MFLSTSVYTHTAYLNNRWAVFHHSAASCGFFHGMEKTCFVGHSKETRYPTAMEMCCPEEPGTKDLQGKAATMPSFLGHSLSELLALGVWKLEVGTAAPTRAFGARSLTVISSRAQADIHRNEERCWLCPATPPPHRAQTRSSGTNPTLGNLCANQQRIEQAEKPVPAPFPHHHTRPHQLYLLSII